MIGRWLKRLTRLVLPRGSPFALTLPTRKSYVDEVGDGLSSSTIMAPLLWIARTFPEAPLILERKRGTAWERDEGNALESLLLNPNPMYSANVLWMATITSFNLSGNAYWLKIRDGRGKVVELWYIPHWFIRPEVDSSSKGFLTHYEYRPGAEVIRLDPTDVVHLRFGLDPRNMRLGLSPLGSVLREVYTDDEAAAFSAALLANLGVPGLIVSPDSDTPPTPEDAQQVKDYIKAKFSGDKRGEPMVLSGRTRVEQFGFNPQQLALTDMRRIPEERVSAVLGVPAIVAGLGAGLARSTFANMSEAREMAYESNIIPTQRLIAADVHRSLTPDFYPDWQSHRLRFDTSDVRVLQEDENKRALRLATLYQRGVIRRSEARRPLGLEVTPEDEQFIAARVGNGGGANDAGTQEPRV